MYLSFQVLKETLTRHGFTFESDTDTEVIPKLAKFVFDKAHDEKGIDLCFMYNSIYVFL
jgi:glutamine---fructose-6-phosphate transaminase (isomerizing)